MPLLKTTAGAARHLRFLALLLALAWVMIVAARILGPSDLYDKEQPRTTSYTVDMLQSGHWILPYDTFGIPATKPPLFNWLSGPFVMIAGYQEWALKFPSILASAGALIVLVLAGRHAARKASFSEESAWATGILAAFFWLAAPQTVKLLYVARPDMLLVSLLGGAWLAATILLDTAASGTKHRGAQIAFWLCTLGAGLDKGPLALFALLYLLLAALLIHRNWRLLLKTGWWWGLPLLLIVTLAWSAAAYAQEPTFFREVLLGRETSGRVASPTRFFTTFFNGPAYMITRFLPWSLLTLLGLVLVKPKQWLKHPLAPAILWMIIIFLVFSFATTKRPDRYAPVFPAMALIAAYCILHLVPAALKQLAPLLTPARLAFATFLVAIGLCLHNHFLSDPARTDLNGTTVQLGDNVISFAQAIRATAGHDPILFLEGEQTPLETLLGNVQQDPPPLSLQQSARWCVRYYDPSLPEKPAAISGYIDQIDGAEPGRLALYPLQPGKGVEEYQVISRLPAIMVDDFGTRGTSEDAQKKWLQFWRLHPDINLSSQPVPTERTDSRTD